MIKMYATDQRGDGMVTLIGEYETIDEIVIRCSLFRPEVVISFEEEIEKEEDEG
ncbi:MAG: hypothetical protein KCHDKBKB_00645 [Elusimicrobia bacterium]|nr:hypothetical protein [Elusimicrobiota bacterium]